MYVIHISYFGFSVPTETKKFERLQGVSDLFSRGCSVRYTSSFPEKNHPWCCTLITNDPSFISSTVSQETPSADNLCSIYCCTCSRSVVLTVVMMIASSEATPLCLSMGSAGMRRSIYTWHQVFSFGLLIVYPSIKNVLAREQVSESGTRSLRHGR